MSQILSDTVLWAGFALMTAAILWLLLRPLTQPRPASAGEEELALYRDQLAELDRDAERGLIRGNELEAARLEISRRLLAADKAMEDAAAGSGQGRPASDTPRSRKIMAVILVAGVPLAALAIYFPLGSPDLPDQPFEARISGPIETLPFEALLLRVEKRVKENPTDIRGRELLANAYMKQERFDDASLEWLRIMQLDGVTAARLASKAETDLLQANGVMSTEIRLEFEKAVALDPIDARAQYYLGRAEIEDGDSQAAIKRWKVLLAAGPENAEWRPRMEAMLARAENPSPSVEPGPSAEDVDAASGMDPEAQARMIEGMVSGLAAKLAENPKDMNGWIRLINAYGVMGREQDRKKSLERARQIFADDKTALARLDAAISP